MKEKIIYAVLAVVFIAVLIGISLGTGKKAEKTKVEAENAVTPVTSANFEKEVLNSDKRVLVDFYADWCGPCKILSPRVAEIANESKDIKVVKINVDQNEDLARKYNISSMPTLLVIENGKELNRAVGALSKSTVLKFVREAK